MAVTTQVSVEEYLRTSYDPDCEYVCGEVLDRNVGEKGHSKVQKRLLVFLAQREAQWGLFALQEWRLRIDERHYRIPDLAILIGPEPDEAMLSTPPFVCVEILSPEDRMSWMQKKIADYLAFGVRYVWVLDPKAQQAFSYTSEGMRQIQDGFLRTAGPVIEIPLAEIFD
jgi:Uma2 family endonuclease